jgi:hypothetical protein
MSNASEKHDALWSDLLDVVERHQEDFNVPQMVSILVCFGATMAFDCAPSPYEAKRVLQAELDYMEAEYAKEGTEK